MTSHAHTRRSARPFFLQLAHEEQNDLIGAGIVRNIPARTEIYVEGRRSPNVAILLTAHAQVVRRSGRDELWLASRVPGDILGELSLVDGRPHSATVRIARPGKVALLSHEAFDRVMRRHENVRNALLRVLASRLRTADSVRGADQGPALVRVARLLERSSHDGRTPAGFQHEIAGMLGVSRSSVVRALSELRERGIVTTRHREIRVVSHAGLARLLAEADGAEAGAADEPRP